MGTSRTDLHKGCEEHLAVTPFVLLWSPPAAAEKALIVEADTIRTKRRDPIVNDQIMHRPDPHASSFADDRLTRWRDIFGGLALLIFCLPLITALAVMVTLLDFGPPFFAQVRVGRNGKPFRCYKLRSMHRDAEKKLHQLLSENPALRSEWAHNRKLCKDPRITRLGAFLRHSSLDELPQLFNVLNGTMSLVGPRPIVLEELQMYGRHVGCYLHCRPGLTGIWQVSGRSETSYRRRVAADRLYARRKSLAFDWKLLWCTIPAVLGRKGAC